MSTQPTFETPRLKLRPYTEADIPELLPLIGTREVAATTLRIAHPYTEQDAKAFLELAKDPDKLWLAITLRRDGRQIGGIGLRVEKQHHHAELGYWLGVPFGGTDTPRKPPLRSCVTVSKHLPCTASSRHISSKIRHPAAF
jgi:[ribosomal protein S5]-alanine N-acetyltransferase